MLAEPPGVWLRVLNVNPSCLFAWKLCRAALILCSPSGMWSHSEPSSSPATALLQILVAAPGFLLPGGIHSQPLFVTDGVPDQGAPASFCHHRWSLTNRWWLQSSVFTSQNTVIPALAGFRNQNTSLDLSLVLFLARSTWSGSINTSGNVPTSHQKYMFYSLQRCQIKYL